MAYYDIAMASRDLLFDADMRALNDALVAGKWDGPEIPSDLGDVLHRVAPVYRDHYWYAHNGANRQWIADAVGRLRLIAPSLVPRLASLYDTPWPSDPVRVDVMWVGRFGGAYTTVDPAHITVSSGDPNGQEWTAAEVLLHETSHLLAQGLFDAVQLALGGSKSEYPSLWHVILFFLTGSAVQEELQRRNIDYQPYMYATRLIDRAWPSYRHPVESSWRPYLQGQSTQQGAITATVDALALRHG